MSDTAAPAAESSTTAKTGALRRKKVLTGTVYSNKMTKTVVVEVTSRQMHPQYGKYVKTRKRFKAHDERQECSIGDTVQIIETRPLSKDKRFRVLKIVNRTAA